MPTETSLFLGQKQHFFMLRMEKWLREFSCFRIKYLFTQPAFEYFICFSKARWELVFMPFRNCVLSRVHDAEKFAIQIENKDSNSWIRKIALTIAL